MAKCRYKYCPHEGVIKETDEVVHVGNAYYHADCYKTKENIDEIIHVFSTEVNKDVVFAQLRKIINNMVNNKKIEPEFILFGIRYYLKHNIPLSYPAGLYYVITNKDVNKAWKAKLAKEYKPEKVEIEEKEHKFTYNAPKKRAVGDLFD